MVKGTRLTMMAVALVALAQGQASANHPASALFVNSFAGTCGGTAYQGGQSSGLCVLGNDVVWGTARTAMDDAPPAGPCNPNQNGGGQNSGCGQGVYLPGLGPPVVRPATPLNLTGRCANASSPSCWSGGNFIDVADGSVHPLAMCFFVAGDGTGGACKWIGRGSFYRPVSGAGAYSGTSEGCSRLYVEDTLGGAWIVFDGNWVHSAGTMLPQTGRVRASNVTGGANHTGSSLYRLSNARSIAPTEPPGAGNGGLTDPGDSGTQRFSANTIQVTLPGNGPASIPAGPGAATYCPGTAF